MIIQDYEIIKEDVRTANTVIYAAKRLEDGAEGLMYAIKEYVDSDVAKILANKEKRISQNLENISKASISIPILQNIISGTENRIFQVMLRKQNGMFLNEIIERLEDRFGKGGIPLEIILDVGNRITDSLEKLHNVFIDAERTGYLHLDLHPGNIFFESTDIEQLYLGHVKFIDFANARPITIMEAAREEEPFFWEITSGYSAPELYLKEHGLYTKATDIYSVAAILFRMACGRVYEPGNMSVEEKIGQYGTNRKLPAILKIMFSSVIYTALSENSLYRYKDAKVMQNALLNVKHCLNACTENNYYDIFCTSYYMMIREEEVIESNINFDKDAFCKAVNYLYEALMTDNIRISQCKYVFDLLWHIAKEYRKEIGAETYRKLLNSGIACCNHISDPVMASELIEETFQIKDKIPILEYLHTRLRIAEQYADTYQYKKAYCMILDTVEYLEQIQEKYLAVCNQCGVDAVYSHIKDLGRAYSAAGRYAALLYASEEGTEKEGFRRKADDFFIKALHEFENDRGNRMITLSHIIHFAVQREFCEKKKDMLWAQYHKYAEEYFGGYVDISEYLKVICQGMKINPFTLHAFLKWIYAFHLEDLTEKDLDAIELFLESKALLEEYDQPIDRIYRNIGLILSACNRTSAWEAFYKAMTTVNESKINLNKPLNILMVINYQTIALSNCYIQQEQDNVELKNLLIEHCQKSGWTELEKELSKGRKMIDILSYEYC